MTGWEEILEHVKCLMKMDSDVYLFLPKFCRLTLNSSTLKYCQPSDIFGKLPIPIFAKALMNPSLQPPCNVKILIHVDGCIKGLWKTRTTHPKEPEKIAP